jgi:uncharacterized protein (DUF1499 family)
MPEGLCDGRLNVDKPNWVSSLVARTESHYIEPLNQVNMQALMQCLQAEFKKITISSMTKDTLIAYRQSRIFNFVDWLCIKKEGAVTASATMGYSDFGKNRELVEQIRLSCMSKCKENCDESKTKQPE